MDIKEIIISEEISIREAMKKLDSTAKKVLIIAKDGKLKALVTDGDIRRWILRNGEFSDSVREIANYKPIYITENEKYKAKDIMKKYSINCLPIVDSSNNIKAMSFWNDLELVDKENKKHFNIPVIIMAGGLGTRLYPYTKILPKPLIPIGDTPIVERIIDKFNDYGCSEFYLAVNYKKNMIKSYFGDIDTPYNIRYIEEDKPLGTGGSLYLVKDKINSTFIVSNCDILIDADYYSIYEEHKKQGNKITMVCAVKNVTIPYGVINLDKTGAIASMEEKPEYSFLTNTGVYFIEPEVLEIIEDNKFIHLPDIVQKSMDNNMKVGVYPITERAWMDMGEIGQMQKMMERLGVK